MAKSVKGKAIGQTTVGMSAPGRANSGVKSPATGSKVSSKPKRAKVAGSMGSKTLANGTKTGIMRLPSGGIS